MYFYQHYGMGEIETFLHFPLAGESFPMHLHRAYEIIMVRRGTLRLQVGRRRYTLGHDEAAFVFPNQSHGFQADPDTVLAIVIFSPEIIGDFYQEYKRMVPCSNVVPMQAPPADTEFDTLWAQKSFVYHVCGLLLRHTELEPASASPKVRLLNQILAYVDEHYSEDCTLKRVAGCLQYDYAYLSKVFRQFTAMSFKDYLNQYRILQACYLLKTKERLITEIALDCGYANLRTFHRNFRRFVQESPADYRRQTLREKETTASSPPEPSGETP